MHLPLKEDVTLDSIKKNINGRKQQKLFVNVSTSREGFSLQLHINA